MATLNKDSVIKKVNQHLRKLNLDIQELSDKCNGANFIDTFAIERYALLLSKRDEKRYFISMKQLFCDKNKYDDWMKPYKTSKEKFIAYANFMVKRFIEHKLRFSIPNSSARTAILVSELELNSYKKFAKFWSNLVGRENLTPELDNTLKYVGIFGF